MGFWNDSYWLPDNMKWTDLKSNETTMFPEFADLSYIFRYSVCILVVRFLLHCFLFLPIGRYFGWLNSSQPLIDHALVSLRCDICGNSKFKRVSETAWRFTYYTIIWLCGILLLVKQPQLYDIVECWQNWPHHSIDNQIWWFYIIQTSFYCSLLLSSFIFDVRRSDFWEMTFHHVVTIGLLLMSYTMNFIRVGMLVLSIHDVSDIFMELGKLFRYAEWNSALIVVFAVFLVIWISTRLIYYPFWIIRSLLIDAPLLIKKDYSWFNLAQLPIVPRIVALMLLLLLILHIYWTYIILKVVVVKASGGEIDDIREESAVELEEDTTVKKKEI